MGGVGPVKARCRCRQGEWLCASVLVRDRGGRRIVGGARGVDSPYPNGFWCDLAANSRAGCSPSHGAAPLYLLARTYACSSSDLPSSLMFLPCRERGSTSADCAPKAQRKAGPRRPAQRKGGRIAPSLRGCHRNGACRRVDRHSVSRALVPFHCGYMAVIRKTRRDEQRAVLRDFVTVRRISSCKMTKSPARPCLRLSSPTPVDLRPTPRDPCAGTCRSPSQTRY
jgi:hypothetical protein